MEPSFTTSSNLSSMLPDRKNSLCLAPPSKSSNLFSSRKSNLDIQLPANSPAPVQEPVQYEINQSYDPNWAGNLEQTGYVETSSSGYAIDYGNAENYVGYEEYSWSTDVTVGSGTGTSVAMEVQDLVSARGKRGRNEMPPEIVEVKQDELMKNRPRQDQVKLTGIAFGPSYQPATSSKEKPSKLHKRKHHIGSLLYDMKQKEMELAESSAKGFLTKAETQAKYGW
ncbi:Proline-rich protein PRCC [Rhynchospora pubera]|uniref:Proline-rich protein PRCC n=1 Tax=Rhynchospora pubera TaxID=906938 RepID=A0AAV8CLI4_9POAL|nr:Proline-rich protein PRCC [Rhynchospora pubera]